MSHKERDGFVRRPYTFTEDLDRKLRWIKYKKGGSMNQRVVVGTEEYINGIIKEIGEPPLDFD